jgi:hypothetical protein
MTSPDEPTRPGATTGPATTSREPTTSTPAAPPAPTDPTSDTPPPATVPVWRSGPAPFPLLLGLLGLVTAVTVLVSEVADLRVPWTDLGPWSVVAVGLVVLVVGAIGLRASRSHD